MSNYTGYKIIFGISLGLFAIAIVASWFLNRRKAEGNFTFRRIIAERKNNANWKSILYAHFFQGLREGTFMFVITIWVFMTTESEFALGKFGLIESGGMFLSFYLVSRIVKPAYRKKAILIGGFLLYLSIFIILFKLTFPLLILYGIIASIAYPLLSVPYMSLTFDVIGKGWKAAEMRIEYIVVRELFYNGGRISSILLFLLTLAVFKNNEDGIRFLMMAIGVGHLAIYFCVRHIQFKKNNEDSSSQAEEARRFRNGEGGSPV